MIAAEALQEHIDELRTAWMKLGRRMPHPVGQWPAHWLMTPDFAWDLRRWAWADGDFLTPDLRDEGGWRLLGLRIETGSPAHGAHWELITLSQ